ncbi:FAD-dependent oxidoreductase [Mesorhizobium sp.]|uniref:NAD(P)/FAD-dependent oxidoreductase n=1 Tax=Mesorhizobium sp. TaxID=1871066 RepID=UPI000FE66E01|nr:FAD-dependent oxidoreductase [Mesorhizobium sp.]RWH78073.1 MAG: NAD(P)/FAD-dependent oxidoreductase [Mesorhizobium sp.]
MTGRLDRVVVVGASVAGVTAAETLRRRGFDGSINLVGAEIHLPYDRPPLSKQVLTGAWDADRVTFRDPATLDQLHVDMRLGVRAVGLDTNNRTVELQGGERLPYDGLIIATGLAPRRLSAGHDLAGVHVLRTIEDALALRRALRPGRRLVVIGAGFLGCEVAAVACEAGLQVCVVDPSPTPMLQQLGQDIGQRAATLHRERGVDIRCGARVLRLIGNGTVTGVELETGDVLDADVVLVAIGSTPETDWLANSGLTIDNGVLCDATCRAAPGVYAAGDVARWWQRTLGTYVRVEHRMNATEQAIAAASNLLGADIPFTPIPYFWTDQYDVKIQAYGSFPSEARLIITQGDPSHGKFIAHYVDKERISGVLSWNMPREIRAERQLIGTPVLNPNTAVS